MEDEHLLYLVLLCNRMSGPFQRRGVKLQLVVLQMLPILCLLDLLVDIVQNVLDTGQHCIHSLTFL